MSDWVEIGGGDGTMWDKQAPIEGTYVNKQTNVGPNNSSVYNLKTEDGDVGVWGSTVIDTKMEQVSIGSQVRIEYLGKAKGKRGEYHDFKVMVKPVSEDVKKVQDVLGGEIV